MGNIIEEYTLSPILLIIFAAPEPLRLTYFHPKTARKEETLQAWAIKAGIFQSLSNLRGSSFIMEL
jgi:hypothetical protein